MRKHFYSNGKLLLTGEYAVLDGALCLAVPTSYGQSLTIEAGEKGKLSWTSTDEKRHPWFAHTFDLRQDLLHSDLLTEKDATAQRLRELFRAAQQLNPDFLVGAEGYEATAKLGFPRNWGLGSSSTLVSNIAEWAGVDPYELLWRTFSGSGYDIACARHNTPVLYRVLDRKPDAEPVNFNPPFREHLFFVHLNQKQDSREGIKRYKSIATDKKEALKEISGITGQITVCSTLEAFESLLERHEQIISSLIQLPTAGEKLFPDYPGQIKSLGAWGGDFVLATARSNPEAYFKSKGYTTVIPYGNMVLETT
ncbi:GYDIA family GHMP kinase [Sinomicrobium weinanense]|uniref:GHMP kinase n=1 Tax=Sinomicrobium weinanense TaxID=2842200 RepID=A0A926Q539_9FLAO|nr:GYDIA family GHMP kinase [Sinomicrobium weinanense]MBC9797741.1 GHMP kinase [Sinomicrobium weinanense]MBU3123632.1 GHMP kinase [Sinomicrobium weinanense]